MIDGGTVVAAGLLANGASEPTFADARWADQSQIVVGVDPLAFGELLEQGAVVDVLLLSPNDSSAGRVGGALWRRLPIELVVEDGFDRAEAFAPISMVRSAAASTRSGP
jgi:hypothetical protein